VLILNIGNSFLPKDLPLLFRVIVFTKTAQLEQLQRAQVSSPFGLESWLDPDSHELTVVLASGLYDPGNWDLVPFQELSDAGQCLLIMCSQDHRVGAGMKVYGRTLSGGVDELGASQSYREIGSDNAIVGDGVVGLGRGRLTVNGWIESGSAWS
jgi:hypothetical protein